VTSKMGSELFCSFRLVAHIALEIGIADLTLITLVMKSF
jgi:hypothetical protein